MATTVPLAAPAPPRPFPACTGIAEVRRVRALTPRCVRVTLGGPALAPFAIEEPGEIVTLLWPAPGRALVLPERGWRFPPGVADAQHARNYTVRSWRPRVLELDVDFALHGDHGRAARWAAAAQRGDRIGFAGPRVHWTTDSSAAWALLVADETGLPALAAIAETLPAGMPAVAVLEVADAAEEQPIRAAAALDVHWLHRDGAQPGALLAGAVAALDLPAGPGRAWGGGESRAMRDVRRHLCDDRGLPADAVSVRGYWKLRESDDWT